LGVGYYYLGAENKLLRFDDEDPEFHHCNKVLWDMAYVSSSFAEKDPRSLRQYLLDNNVHPRYLPLADAGYCNTAGGTLDSVPASRACNFERAWEGDGTSVDPDFRMEPSYRILVEHLAEGLKIRTSSPVTDVSILQSESSSHPVTVRTKNGLVVRAKRAIVAVPLPILKQEYIKFDPPLSKAKVDAAKSLAFANGAKVVLKFSRAPWPADCHGAVCGDSFIPECWMNGTRPVGTVIVGKADYSQWCDDPDSDDEEGHDDVTSKPSDLKVSNTSKPAPPMSSETFKIRPSEPGVFYICSGFLMGTRADQVCKLAQSTIIARFLSQLDRMFNMDATGAFVEGFLHNWGDEPFIHGAYSTPTMGEGSGAAAVLAEPHLSKVFFAGEAVAGAVDGDHRAKPDHKTHFAPPIVLHGAMNTGSAAACDVARSLGIRVKCHADEASHLVDASSNPSSNGQLSVSTIALDSPKSCVDLRRHAYDSIKSQSPQSSDVKTGYQVPVFKASKEK
jgi:hypothetical protein